MTKLLKLSKLKTKILEKKTALIEKKVAKLEAKADKFEAKAEKFAECGKDKLAQKFQAKSEKFQDKADALKAKFGLDRDDKDQTPGKDTDTNDTDDTGHKVIEDLCDLKGDDEWDDAEDDTADHKDYADA